MERRYEDITSPMCMDPRLKTCRSTCLFASPLLLLLWHGGSYYECSPPLWRTTSANFQAQPVVELCVIGNWCVMLFFFRTVLASMPAAPNTSSSMPNLNNPWRFKRARQFLAWFLWVWMVALSSLPSVLYAFSNSLPANNTLGISDALLSFVHSTAPVLTVLIDMVVAVRKSTRYSRLTGIKADKLLMTFRLASAWLFPLLTTIILDENCISAWKWTWTVCKTGSPQHHYFDLKIYDEEILNTQTDICNLSETWWSDGRCSRAIVGNLTPFLLQKCLLRSTLQPLALLFMWQFSRLERHEDRQQGCHLRLFGCGPRASSSLAPLQQMSLLTTQLELLIFWSPLVPLLSVGILGAGIANLLMFDLGVWTFGVKLPSDDINRGARISRSYLGFALCAGCCFQIWHAFSSKMYGRYLLLFFSMATMGPWAKRFLPLERARYHLWDDGDKVSETQIIEMSMRTTTSEPVMT